MPVCYECGQPGHVKSNCPSIQCHRCHQRGHMARDCLWTERPQQQHRQSRPQTRGPAHRRFDTSLPPPSSNAHKIPSHWLLSEDYTSLTTAVTGLWKQEKKFVMCQASMEERAEIEQLARKTWKEDVIGFGADARNLTHSNIQVVTVERIENPELYERYSEKKQKMLRRVRDPDSGDTAFSRVDSIPGSSGPVLTTQCMAFDSGLRRNIYPKINEHYLFHGTKDEYVRIITRDGMDNRFGSKHSLLGPGLYTAESCTKADQYTDDQTSRTGDLHKMLLVRVLMGQPFLNSSKNPAKYQRPPCRSCQQILCDCPHTVHYDSVLDDSGRLFREFVVYEQCQCYPEYVITYRRVGGSASTRNYNPASSSALASTWTSALQNQFAQSPAVATTRHSQSGRSAFASPFSSSVDSETAVVSRTRPSRSLGRVHCDASEDLLAAEERFQLEAAVRLSLQESRQLEAEALGRRPRSLKKQPTSAPVPSVPTPPTPVAALASKSPPAAVERSFQEAASRPSQQERRQQETEAIGLRPQSLKERLTSIPAPAVTTTPAPVAALASKSPPAAVERSFQEAASRPSQLERRQQETEALNRRPQSLKGQLTSVPAPAVTTTPAPVAALASKSLPAAVERFLREGANRLSQLERRQQETEALGLRPQSLKERLTSVPAPAVTTTPTPVAVTALASKGPSPAVGKSSKETNNRQSQQKLLLQEIEAVRRRMRRLGEQKTERDET